MADDEELRKIDELIRPPGPPERIHGWANTQLSIARYYGGINYLGHRYVISYAEEGRPLVRWDVVDREAREAKAANARRRAASAAKQDSLF